MGENVTKNKAKNLMRKAILTQHKFNSKKLMVIIKMF